MQTCKRLIGVVAAVAVLAGCAGQPEPQRVGDRDADTKIADTFATYLSARFAAGDHDLGQAALFYSRSLENDPANPQLLALSFFYATTAGDLDSAARYASRVVAATPDDRAARLALAVMAFKRKDYADVRHHLTLSARGPFTVLTLSLFDAWAAAASKDEPAVAKDIADLAGQKGAENIAAYHAALLADYLGKTQAAETAYKKAIAGNVVTPRVLEAYGRFLEGHGRAADAEALYRSRLDEGGLAVVTVPGLARIAAKQKAEPMIRTPEDGAAEALFGIAASLTDAQSADISILYLRMALYLRPDLTLANILLADRFESIRKYEDAIAVYRTVPVSSPYFRVAAVQAAINLSRLGRPDDAVADLRKLVASQPKDVESWIALGDTYRAAERYAEAVQAYDGAAKALGTPGRKDWTLFYARAMSMERLKRLDESEADIQTALKLSPDQPELLNYLGYSWVDRGRNIDQALVMLEKARSLRPYDGYIVDSVGWAYYRLGRWQDAANTLAQAVLLVPGDPTINDHLGDAFWRSGRRIEARFQWNHALTFADGEVDKAAIEKKIKTGLAG
jgi:tetratricopeptide (TPR) repeat protein